MFRTPASIPKTDVELVKFARAKSGMDQREFCSCIGLSRNTLKKWEEGKRARLPSSARLLLGLLWLRPALIDDLERLNSSWLGELDALQRV